MAEHTEASMLALLERRYRGEDRGNGPAWAFIPHVRNAAGFDANRTIDALAMSLWPSRGLEIHGHEIKVSRSDWLREMRDPAKAEAFAQFCDRWWLVVSDAKIVQDGELPPTWGLLVVRGKSLAVKVQAPKLERDGERMPQSFLASLLRAACRTTEVTPAEVQDAIRREREMWEKHYEENIERWRDERDQLRAKIKNFERAAGVQLGDAGDPAWYHSRPAEEVGAALRIVLNGEADLSRFEERYSQLAATAEKLAADLRKAARRG